MDSKTGEELPPGESVDVKLIESGVDGELSIDVNESPLQWFSEYYNNEKKTKERFVTNKNTGKLYNLTEDTARYRIFCFNLN